MDLKQKIYLVECSHVRIVRSSNIVNKRNQDEENSVSEIKKIFILISKKVSRRNRILDLGVTSPEYASIFYNKCANG